MIFSSFFKITAAVIITITAISFSSCSEEDNNLHEPVFDASTPEQLQKTTGNRVEKVTNPDFNVPDGLTAYYYYYNENAEPQILLFKGNANSNKQGLPIEYPVCDRALQWDSQNGNQYIKCLNQSGTTCKQFNDGTILICGDHQ